MYRDFLLPMVASGEIVKLERQKPYTLIEGYEYEGKKIRPVMYIADFVVTYADGRFVVYDFKGMPDDVAKIKRKLFCWKYPNIHFEWIGYSKIDGGYVPYEKIVEGRKARKAAKTAKSKK